MIDTWLETYNYYDGHLSGLIYAEGTYKYFVIRDESPLHPSDNDPDGRIYDVWVLDEEPNESQKLMAWWRPSYPPTSSITESELWELPEKS